MTMTTADRFRLRQDDVFDALVQMMYLHPEAQLDPTGQAAGAITNAGFQRAFESYMRDVAQGAPQWELNVSYPDIEGIAMVELWGRNAEGAAQELTSWRDARLRGDPPVDYREVVGALDTGSALARAATVSVVVGLGVATLSGFMGYWLARR